MVTVSVARRRALRARLNCIRLEGRWTPATFTVLNLNDSGAGSLRQAIAGANGNPGADDIVFQPGVVGAITLTTGELSITSGLSILGPGIVVNGNNATRVFNTSGAPAGAAVAFVNLAIVNGKVAGDGAGILAGDEALTLIACNVSGNHATGAGSDGGGIAVLAAPGSLSLFSCSVTNNVAEDRHGGGIDLATGVTATIASCAITSNTAFDAGGGLHSVSGGLTITNTTLSGNAGKRGGAVNFFGTVGAGGFTVRNSTLSGNTSAQAGGGISLVSFTGTLTVQNSTITNNAAGGSGGGGVGREAGGGVIELESTIVSLNSDTSASANDDLFTTGTVNAKTSAIGTKSGVTTFNADATTLALLGDDLKLAPLASGTSSGAGLKVHVPAPDSPVIDKGSNPAGLTTDQRGSTGVREANGVADIGAVELQVFLVTNTNDSGAGSLRTAVNNANSFVGSDTVRFSFTSAETITLTTGDIVFGESVTVTGPAARVTISGGGTSRIFNLFDKTTAGSTFVFQNLTLTNGKGVTFGGAIFADTLSLTLQNCTITNSAAGSGGGAIFIRSSASSLLVEDCTLTGNTAGTVGGAVHLALGTPAVLRRSTLSGNTAFIGGAVYAIGGDLTVEDSTLSGNTATTTTADDGGGAIYFTGAPGDDLLVTHSTFSGNTAPSASGGAVLIDGIAGNAAATFRNCTITANSAGGKGGGVFGSEAAVTLASTIVAGNTNAAGPDLAFNAATNVSSTKSIVGVVDAGGFTLIGSGNQTGAKASPLNAKLGTLANNGGPTFTHQPLTGSPAIDQGSNPAGLATDQRGPGFERVRGTAADVGAVETGQSLVVTNVNDSGLGSLRQAVINANVQVGADTVNFDPAFFATAKTILLTTGVIAINQALSVNGPAAKVTIDGNAADTIFRTIAAPAGAVIVLSNLALTNGNTVSFGGAIRGADEALTLKSCSVTNSAGSSGGGAIMFSSAAGSVIVENSVLSGNSTSGGGGAIYSYGAVTVRGSTISGNSAGAGGAIFLVPGSSLTLEASTLSGNSAGAGGAISISGPAAFLVSNSTLSGNSTGGSGGAVAFVNLTSTAVFRNSTVTGNTAAVNGGGIARLSGSVGVSLSSTVIAGNSNANSPDLSFNSSTKVGAVDSIIGVGDAGNFTLSGTGTQTGTKASPLDAKLGPLAANGGPTQTHALLAGSPALNTGNNVAGLANDQRGAGFARAIGAPDIGAFEVQTLTTPTKITTVVVNSGALQRSRVTSLAITFDVAPSLPANPLAAFQLKRQSDNLSVTMNGNLVGTTVTLTFTAGPVDAGSLADGRYTLTVLAAQISNLDGNGDGTIGDDFVLVGNPAVAPKLFRLFGDSDGDNDVDTTDFGAFRAVFGSASTIFDFDNDGDVDTSDFGAFRSRFGASV